MFHFDVVIPTLDRKEKLEKCRASLGRQTVQCFKTYIYEDVNHEKAPRIWNRHLRNNPGHSIVFICDDIELDSDCFEELLKIDLLEDRLVGFNQKNLETSCKAAMGWVGTKFADNFQDRQVWCPDYDNMHVDGELVESAEHFGAFLYAPQCKLVHHHPVTDTKLFDDTHNKTREFAERDREVRRMRKEKGLLWGRTFERLR